MLPGSAKSGCLVAMCCSSSGSPLKDFPQVAQVHRFTWHQLFVTTIGPIIGILERHFGQIWWLHLKGENSPYNGAWRALLGLAGPSKGGLDTVG